jgi:N-acetylneuraminic acid mutarotase
MRHFLLSLRILLCLSTLGLLTSGCDKEKVETIGRWTQKVDFPGTLRQGTFSFAVNGKGYMGLGQYIGNFHKDLWAYDPAADAWSPKAAFPGIPKSNGGVFVVNQKAYLVAGVVRSEGSVAPARDVWEYDPANDRWTQKKTFPGTGGYASGFNAGNTGYISNDGKLWQYVPETDEWLPKTPLPSGVIVVANETIYGLSDNNDTTEVWQYSPLTNTWELINSTSPGVPGGIAFGLRSRIFVGSEAFSQFDPATKKWQEAGRFTGHQPQPSVHTPLDSSKSFVIGDKAYIGTSGRYGKALWEFAY